MMTTERRELADWEKAECAALKAAISEYNAKKIRSERITQEVAGAKLGMNQGSFSNYLNGRLALNKDVAMGVFKIFGIPVEKFSPRLASEIGQIVAVYGESNYQTDKRYLMTTPEHRQAVDEMASHMLSLSPEQAIKFKQAVELLMPAAGSRNQE